MSKYKSEYRIVLRPIHNLGGSIQPHVDKLVRETKRTFFGFGPERTEIYWKSVDFGIDQYQAERKLQQHLEMDAQEFDDNGLVKDTPFVVEYIGKDGATSTERSQVTPLAGARLHHPAIDSQAYAVDARALKHW